MNEQSAISTNIRNQNTFNCPREYDLVAKVDKITIATNQTDTLKIMSGGRHPEIKIRKLNDNEETKEIEPIVRIKISDTSQMQFEIIVPKSLVPEGV